MSASREAISRASIRTATSSPAGSRLPERDEASSASQSLRAPAAGAPARLAAFENLRQPAALWNRLALSFSGALQNAGEVQERMRMYHTQEDERK